MIIKLCYKEYPAKLSLGSMDYYEQATGRDLWRDLLKYLEAWQKLKGLSTLEVITGLHDVVSFKNASYIFHSVIREEDSSRSLKEVQDAMFAVGWLPSDEDSTMAEPWPLVMYQVALDIHQQLSDFARKKRLAASEQ
jgi:hypothetical protein